MKRILFFTLSGCSIALFFSIVLGLVHSERFFPPLSMEEYSGKIRINSTKYESNEAISCEKLQADRANTAWRECLLTWRIKIKSWEQATVFLISASAWLDQVPEDTEIQLVAREVLKKAWGDLKARKGTPEQAWFLDQCEVMIEAPELYKKQGERRLDMFP